MSDSAYEKVFDHVKIFCSQAQVKGFEERHVLAFLWRQAAGQVSPDRLQAISGHLQAFVLFLLSESGYESLDALRPWDFSRFVCSFYPKQFWPMAHVPPEVFVGIQRDALTCVVDYVRFLAEVGGVQSVQHAEDALEKTFEEQGRVRRLRRPSQVLPHRDSPPGQ